VSVARAREVMARARAAGITVHEWPGWESRGNGLTSAYEGIINHHTATPFGFAFQALVTGRPDLAGPLCNTSGNADGSVTMIAAHPANHAGGGYGPSLGPLPRTSLFNPRVWGHEIVYPGTVEMTGPQYRTAAILSRISVDVFGYGDIERARFHAETNGRGYDGKWDPGRGNGVTYDAAAFRRFAATILEADMQQDERDRLFRMYDILESANNGTAVENGLGNIGQYFRLMYEAVMSMHQRGFLPIREGAIGGDLTWFQEQSETALEPVMRAITAAPAGGPIDYARLVAAQAASPDYMRALGEAVAAATDRRARDGDPTTGPTT
jgi:hypothetical protein